MLTTHPHPQTTTTTHKLSTHPTPAAIGSAIGGILGFFLIISLYSLWLFQRNARRNARQTTKDAQENPAITPADVEADLEGFLRPNLPENPGARYNRPDTAMQVNPRILLSDPVSVANRNSRRNSHRNSHRISNFRLSSIGPTLAPTDTNGNPEADTEAADLTKPPPVYTKHAHRSESRLDAGVGAGLESTLPRYSRLVREGDVAALAAGDPPSPSPTSLPRQTTNDSQASAARSPQRGTHIWPLRYARQESKEERRQRRDKRRERRRVREIGVYDAERGMLGVGYLAPTMIFF